MESSPPPPPPSAIPSSNSKAVIDYGERNWLDLPRDAILSVFRKLDTIDTLVRARNVCKTWRKISEDPFLYRTIDMPNSGEREYTSYLEALCHRAVDYSCGQLVDINIDSFGTDDLLHHVADSARHLRRLHLASCWDVSEEGMCEVAEKFPHLEEIDITIGNLSDLSLGAIGRCCPQLKTCKFNSQVYRLPPDDESNNEAFAIAKTMPGLRHLQLIGNHMTNDGLLAILDGCPLLESLDMRRCFNVNLVGSLGKRCREQIKHLRLPCDATDDYGFLTEDDGSAGEDYPDGISDIELMTDDDYAVYPYGYDEFSDGEFSDDNPYDF